MLTFKQFTALFLTEVNKKTLIKRNDSVPEEVIDAVLDMDPSKDKSFAPWILNLWRRDNKVLNQKEKIQKLIDTYIRFKDEKFQGHDIQSVKSVGEFETTVGHLVDQQTVAEKRLGHKVLFEDDTWKITEPLTWEYSNKFSHFPDGFVTKWCISADSKEGRRIFKDYTDKSVGARLVFLENKKDGERYVFRWEDHKLKEVEDRYNNNYTKNPWGVLEELPIPEYILKSLVGEESIEDKFFRFVESGRSSSLDQFLENHPGIDVNVRGGRAENTALILASMKGRTLVVELLLQHPKIDVNAHNIADYTALMLASRDGYPKVVELLLQHPKIDVNAQDKNENTALIWARWGDHTDIIKLLKDAGAKE